jgi:hypothetical protein
VRADDDPPNLVPTLATKTAARVFQPSVHAESICLQLQA